MLERGCITEWYRKLYKGNIKNRVKNPNFLFNIESFLKRILLTCLPFVKFYDGLLRQPPLGGSCGAVDNYIMKGGFKKKMFKFKKVASLFASTVLLGSTIGFAAATTFPAPFVDNGSGNVAIVYGSNAATSITDLVAATNIADTLNSHVVGTSTTGGTTTTVEGEAYPLFTDSSELFLNSTLNSVRTTLAEQELPTILQDGTFDGQVTATYEQRILLGSNPVITFAQMPTTSDDPKIGIQLGTTPSTQGVYNATVTFDQAVNFTHADSVGEDLTLFGQKFTVGAASTGTKLVLLKTSEQFSLSSDDPTTEAIVGDKTYTIELVSASDTDATVKVTDENGNSDTKTISEAASKKMVGVEVSVDNADETNFKLSATISVGSDRITLQDGSAVKIGSDEDALDGTNVEFELANGSGSTSHTSIGKLVFQVAAKDSDNDAIFPGQSYVDPVFGSFKVDFSGISIPTDSATDREMFEVYKLSDVIIFLHIQLNSQPEFLFYQLFLMF